MAGAERQRKNTRVEFHTTATLDFSGQLFEDCPIRDLSMKGLFAEGVNGPREKDTCSIILCLSGTSSELCLNMKGTVVRSVPDGVALHFDEIDFDGFFHLRNIIYYHTEDPDSLEESLRED